MRLSWTSNVMFCAGVCVDICPLQSHDKDGENMSD